MKFKTTILLAIVLLVPGCSVPREVFTGSPDCGYIGCKTGGLVVYPHE